MSLFTESTEGGPQSASTQGGSGTGAGALLTGLTGDRCIHCNARLAIDQRYCVECGTRRGNPRFTLARVSDSQSTSAGIARTASSAITRLQLLSALLVVLIAVGVGVLIGQAVSGTPRVVVGSGGGAQTISPGSGATGGGSGAAGGGSASSRAGTSSKSGGNLFNTGS